MTDLPSGKTPPRMRRGGALEPVIGASVGGLDQDLDPAVTTEARVTERARLDLVRGNAGLDQRVANGADTTVAQVLVARVAAARIPGAVDGELERRILVHVAGDVGHLVLIDRVDVGPVVLEHELPERGPAIHHTHRALRARRAHRALRTGGTGTPGLTGDPGH